MRRISIIILFLLWPLGSLSGETDPVLARQQMVKDQLIGRDIKDKRILTVMYALEREKFLPEAAREAAYEDICISLEGGRVFSSPYFMAYRLEMLQLNGRERILEIGVWPGYETALLAQLCKEVYAVEEDKVFVAGAEERIKTLGYENIKLIVGGEEDQWRNYAPFDVIIINKEISYAPKQLIEQLNIGGRILIPVAEKGSGKFLLIRKQSGRKGAEETTAQFFTPPDWKKSKEDIEKGSKTVESANDDSKKWETSEDSKWKRKRRLRGVRIAR